MNIIHVTLRDSIFADVIRRRAESCGQQVIFYDRSSRLGLSAQDFVRLYRQCLLDRAAVYVFHWVPHTTLFLLINLVKGLRFALGYWGDDFYFTFLSSARLEVHALSKSPLLKSRFYALGESRLITRVLQAIRLRVGLAVIRNAAGVISLCPKHFRYVRWVQYKMAGKRLATPHIRFAGYSSDEDIVIPDYQPLDCENAITVLICHSATPSVAHSQSLDLLRAYREKWGVKIHVRGFLSYSGGSEADRDQLARKLVAEADFAETVTFEKTFLPIAEVTGRLSQYDIAVFSCIRDEGVSLLRQFVKLGGLVCFNRFSLNYDFFRGYCMSKLLTHEEFLVSSPQQLVQARQRPPSNIMKLTTFEELGRMEILNGKLHFPGR